MRYVRAIEIVLGVVFVYSAIGKALDIPQFAQQVQYYGLVTEPSAVKFLAYFMIVLETVFAACLLGGYRFQGFIYLATTALLLGFSGLVIYAWSYRGLEDCGCFGVLMQMGPKGTLAKNAVLIGLTAGAWAGMRRHQKVETAAGTPAQPRALIGHVLAAVGTAAVLIASALGEDFARPAGDRPGQSSSTPFGKYVFTTEMNEHIDLGSGEYFVAMLSADCEHCQAASQVLNEIWHMPGMPTTVALLMGKEDEIENFNVLTQPMFITHVIDSLEWGHLIGKEPPRFYVLRDGHAIRQLDALEPTLEELYAFAVQPADETSSPRETETAS